MIYAFITPLLFSVLIPVPPINIPLAEVQENHIKTTMEPPLQVACSCVQYAISQGANIPLVDAKNITATTTVPYKGSVAVFYYPNSGLYHVAVVTGVYGGFFSVTEANYSACKISQRIVYLNDKRLLGFR